MSLTKFIQKSWPATLHNNDKLKKKKGHFRLALNLIMKARLSAKFLLRKLVFIYSANKPQVYIHSMDFFRGFLVLFEGRLRFKMGGFHNKTAFNTKLADMRNYSNSPLANTEY